MKNGLRRRPAGYFQVALILGLLIPVCIAPACADDSPAAPPSVETRESSAVRIAGLRPGFSGKFKVGYWLPVVVELTGGPTKVRGRVEITVPDSEGIPSRVHAPADFSLEIAAGQGVEVPLYVKPGQLTGDFTVSFVTESGPVASRQFAAGSAGPLAGALPTTASLYLSLGLNHETSRPGTRGPALIDVDQLNALPGDWFGLEGVDAVLLGTSNPQFPDQLATASEQLDALELWVRMGGQLIVSVGRAGAELLSAGGPLARFAPGEFESLVTLRQSTMFETYVESSDPLSTAGPLEVSVSKLRNVRGRVEAFAGSGPADLPLVVRTPHGFGQIVFVTFDLAEAPFANWSARPQLIEKLLARAASQPTEDTAGTLGAVTTLGFVDLSGQLRAALDQFPGVRFIPFWLVALLIAVYLACIGPLDYYLVRRVLRRPAATWVTFSIIVLAFSATAVGLAFGLKGRELRVNQVQLVDHDVELGFVRGTTWANVFSPQIETYDLALSPVGHAPPTGTLVSWFGLSGTGFGGIDSLGGATGGMGSAASTLPLFTVPYDYSAGLSQLDRVPIAMWSSKAFVGRSWQQAAGAIEADLADDGRLTGIVANRSQETLRNCVLIYDRWAYVIRDFAPGRELDLALDVDPQTVDTYLRNVRAVGDRKVATPYDQATFDVRRIVEMLSAQDLAGGRSYTGLANQYQRFAELSNLVRIGRAVLIGEAPSTTVALQQNGQPLAAGDAVRSWTFHRYVFPVANRPAR